eukprot:scaffold306780_cov19-Tisochrysis_lutea.AAC.1
MLTFCHLQTLFIIVVGLAFELNVFFLKYSLWIPPTNPLITYRCKTTRLSNTACVSWSVDHEPCHLHHKQAIGVTCAANASSMEPADFFSFPSARCRGPLDVAVLFRPARSPRKYCCSPPHCFFKQPPLLPFHRVPPPT